MFKWKVQRLCREQLLDVDPKDILKDGLYRKCNSYKSGGGYDEFPRICKKRLGLNYSNQFVVQLRGCPLDCWYCYVTRNGVTGRDCRMVSTNKLIEDFNDSNMDIFHLMGGAPALYLENWPLILDKLDQSKVFHSDLMLIEKEYKKQELINVRRSNTLYAVNIKGVTEKNYYENTGRHIDWELFWKNFDAVAESDIQFYITFTNPNNAEDLNELLNKIVRRYGKCAVEDYYSIKIIEYNAISGKKPYDFNKIQGTMGNIQNRRIDIGFETFKGLSRSEIIGSYCPDDMDDELPGIDIDSYNFETDCVDRGCRGITCEECWDCKA